MPTKAKFLEQSGMDVDTFDLLSKNKVQCICRNFQKNVKFLKIINSKKIILNFLNILRTATIILTSSYLCSTAVGANVKIQLKRQPRIENVG